MPGTASQLASLLSPPEEDCKGKPRALRFTHQTAWLSPFPSLTWPWTTAVKTARKFCMSALCSSATIPASSSTRQSRRRGGCTSTTSVSHRSTTAVCSLPPGLAWAVPCTRMFPGCRSACTKLSMKIWKTGRSHSLTAAEPTTPARTKPRANSVGLFPALIDTHHLRQQHSQWLRLQINPAQMGRVLLAPRESAELGEATLHSC